MNMYRIYLGLATSIVAFCLFYPPTSTAQAAGEDQKPVRQVPRDVSHDESSAKTCGTSADTVHTFYLRNATQMNDANEIYTSIRQMLPPEAKTFFVPNQMAIELCAPPEQIALAQKMLTDLDRPKKNYRLTYTVSEMDGATHVSTHHFSMVVTPGQQATLKQGSRVPVVSGPGSTFSYVDVGMNFDATIDTTSEGIRLRTTVEQSSVAEGKGVGPESPVIRQATFKGTSYMVPNKPLKVGTFDIPDTSRHLDLEVMMEPLP
jgi:hypothetical protein